MLYSLSIKYSREIALMLIAVFFISGLNALKAEVFSGINFYTAQKYGCINSIGIKKSCIRNGANLINSEEIKLEPTFPKTINVKNRVRSNDSIYKKVNLQNPLVGGPSQPEMSAFKPVSSDNMVSPFTGDFSYNIPLLDVGGYPVNMFYNSGITMDQDASWVGLGWNINPGTVTRNLRGVPDDFDGTDMITKRQSMRPDKTWGISASGSIKLAGFPIFRLEASTGLSFNNKLGVAVEAGVHPSVTLGGKNTDGKTVSLGVSLNASSRSGASVTPSISVGMSQNAGEGGTLQSSLGLSYTYSSRMGLSAMHLNAGVTMSHEEANKYYNDKTQSYMNETVTGSSNSHTLSSSISFAYPSVAPSIKTLFTHSSYNLSFSMGTELFSLEPHGRIGGFYTETKIADQDKETKHPAYGILHYQDAKDDINAMLDFNRANDGVYTPGSPAIAMPVYTYDVFSVNGEGTGGCFRAYRADLGYMRDGHVKTKDDAFSLGLDLGFANTIHGGVEFSYAYTPTEAGEWNVNNTAKPAFTFQPNHDKYQAVYFKNPGEKTIPDPNFQNTIGGENLVRLKMANTNTGTPLLLPNLLKYDKTKNLIGEQAPLTANSAIKPDRDKRTQVISFLTAEEAERVGFDKLIYSYRSQDAFSDKVIFGSDCNRSGIDSFYRNSTVAHAQPIPGDQSYRKGNHISEIDVLGTDGRKYVYGIPVYNISQVDVSFSVNHSQGNSQTGKASYDEGDDNASNTKGREWFMQQQQLPAYTHSFLLTELTSPNYVDVTGNGISEDDMGDAVKFNYTKFPDYQWRTPVGSSVANYNEGLKTDEKDDKASYVYGVREMWHLYSIESKNMVARFYVKNDRTDCRQVQGQTGTLDNTWGMQRLDKISLFSKADLTREMNGGVKAKPVKTIQFFQSYKLCKNNSAAGAIGNNSNPGSGKLTLDSIRITYNGNEKKAKTRYVFYYPQDNNPDYEFNANDRWGNYKPETDNGVSNNPPGLTNTDYPYSVQNVTKAGKYAAAWTMNKILLPSGGVIKIDYESDSYAYVQDKKATSFCNILGFGNTSAPNAAEQTNPYLYRDGSEDYQDNDWVYIKLPYAITNTNSGDAQRELGARYFDNLEHLYIKLAVTMPSGGNVPGLSGSETIPVYADFDNFGLVPNSGGTVAFVHVTKVVGSTNPMVQQSLQFLKQQLPGKAYPGYDLSEESGAKSIVLALAGMVESIGPLLKGDDKVLKQNRKCKEVVTSNSFARLTNPYFAKLGGGLRVRKVTINDNWNAMTHQYEASYGQEYRYTTKETINGKEAEISSGVAAWEPSIGSDENPHKQIMRYMDHTKGGPYDFGAIEMPLGEMFYPAPVVGYSRIEIVSIHRDTVKNLPTRQVTEFYTTKDFPFRSTCTQLEDPGANVKYEPSAIKQLLRLDMKKSVTQSQGFLVELNDMNGREKFQATYSASDSIHPVSSTEHFYNVSKATDKTYQFNHVFPTIEDAHGVVNNCLIGRDIELMADFRQHTTETITTNLSINFDMFLIGWFPIPLFNPLQPVIKESMTYRSASLLKIINHYGMLDSVVNISNGSQVSTKNLLYDAETGNVLLTRTNNIHNKPIYSFNYSAHWAYSGMGPAYKNIDATYASLNFSHGILQNPPPGINDILESGDELYVVAENSDDLSAIAPCDDNSGNTPQTTLKKSGDFRIWAVNTAKGGALPGTMVFMNKDGDPYNAKDATIRIIRSGHRNMLDQTVGSIVSLNNPIVNGQLQVGTTTAVLQTTAATFKDNWRVDNAFYPKDSVVATTLNATIKKMDLLPVDYMNLRSSKYSSHAVFYEPAKEDFLNLYKWSKASSRGHHSSVDYRRSFLEFDYSVLPPNSRLYRASLSLFSHTIRQNLHLLPIHIFYPEYFHHPVLQHSAFESQYLNVIGEVHAMKGNWYNVNDPNGWGNTYAPWGTEYNVTGLSPIFSATMGNEDYDLFSWSIGYREKRILVTDLINQAAGYPLSQSKKIGLMLKLNKDHIVPGQEDIADMNGQFRCFWSALNCPSNTRGSTGNNAQIYSCSAIYPRLSYYYYLCGDSTMEPNTEYDPYVNNLVSCNLIRIIHYPVCPSKFTKIAINPYVEGVLGNWRADTIYTYYGDRKEKEPNPNVSVDTRIAGTIDNFQPFWTSTSNYSFLQRNYAAASVWVWNSTSTQFNRKGYELENKDPLGRFNAGLYGYNQQLPIAVANNARLREILFDGFEDYSYQANLGCPKCRPTRYFKFATDISTNLSTVYKHSGQYSLRVSQGTSVTINAPVTDTTIANQPYGLNIQANTTAYTGVGLGTGGYAGTGLKSTWYNHPYIIPATPVLEPGENSNLGALAYATTPFVLAIGSPRTGVNEDYFSVKWEGFIQAPQTGNYRFSMFGSNGFRLKINGQWLTDYTLWTNGTTFHSTVTPTVPMVAGNTYTIEVCFYNLWGPAIFNLRWQNTSAFGGFSSIPLTLLYPPGSTQFHNVITTSTICSRLNESQVTGNALTDTLSLLQNKKMVLGAWVKEVPLGSPDCKCSSYVKNSITIAYTGSSQTETMQPVGNIIEGWQRYESVFTVPATATAMSLSLNNLAGSNADIFFDDIRIHPFNANLKSFVYNQSNLRLMAELDENNYASFYEYDDDGTLARTKKETERGIKTITETRSATQKTIVP